jgi:hypothetical protein
MAQTQKHLELNFTEIGPKGKRNTTLDFFAMMKLKN